MRCIMYSLDAMGTKRYNRTRMVQTKQNVREIKSNPCRVEKEFENWRRISRGGVQVYFGVTVSIFMSD